MFWDGWLRERADHRLLIEWAAIDPGRRMGIQVHTS